MKHKKTLKDYEKELRDTGSVQINGVAIITTPFSYRVIEGGDIKYVLPLKWYTPTDVVWMTVTKYPFMESVAY